MIASWVEWSQLRLPRTRGLGLDFQVGQNITGLLSVFRKFLSRVKNREWKKINRFLISLSSHYSTRTMLCIIDYNLA
ncbi:hypothetical protein SFRURICE_008420, partial [Spodoptera frugiperda]